MGAQIATRIAPTAQNADGGGQNFHDLIPVRDPNQIREVRTMMRRLGEQKTILLSTHILQEVEAMADRLILIDNGKVVFDGKVDELGGKTSSLEEAFCQRTGPT